MFVKIGTIEVNVEIFWDMLQKLWHYQINSREIRFWTGFF